MEVKRFKTISYISLLEMNRVMAKGATALPSTRDLDVELQEGITLEKGAKKHGALNFLECQAALKIIYCYQFHSDGAADAKCMMDYARLFKPGNVTPRSH